jgi:hypothetical protein
MFFLYNKFREVGNFQLGGYILMRLALILLVIASFLAAIFASGYNDRPGLKNK